MLATRIVDRQRADDRLRHRDRNLPLALVDIDGAVGLVDNDRLEPFLVERRPLVTRALGAAFRIAGSAGLELRGRGRLPIADFVFGRLQRGRRLQSDFAVSRHRFATVRWDREVENGLCERRRRCDSRTPSTAACGWGLFCFSSASAAVRPPPEPRKFRLRRSPRARFEYERGRPWRYRP